MDVSDEKRKEYQRVARKNLRDARYDHTLAVAKLAEELAACYHESVFKASVAGLLHDITKEFTDEEQLHIIKNSDILLSKILTSAPNIYHSVTASIIAKNELSINDTDILNAIRYHTTGRAGMSVLEKIIYVADAVSYDRTYPEAEQLRNMAFEDLDGCMLEILQFTIKKLAAAGAVIAVDTIFCYNELCEQKNNL